MASTHTPHESDYGFWISVVLPILFNLWIFYIFYTTHNFTYNTILFKRILSYLKFFWFSGFLFSLSNILGFIFFGSPKSIDNNNIKRLLQDKWDKNIHLVVVYVSRGDNLEALIRSIKKTISEFSKLEQLKVYVNYSIEVVTDIKPPQKKLNNILQDRLHWYVVPPSYQTPNRAKHKARALQFLIDYSQQRGPKSWCLHMDEESVITISAIAGIHKFIKKAMNNNDINIIGQGEILYNAYKYGYNKLITLIDSVRSGDDLGRFRLQYKLFNKPLFGMHGSFFLVHSRLEKLIGFDLSGSGSITEDAFFALKAYERGIRFQWLDGHIKEQSPFCIKDIIKQRRRWFCGLMQLSINNSIKLRYRLILLFNNLLWSIAWIGPFVTIANIIVGGSFFPSKYLLLANLMTGIIGSVYLVGAYRNLENSPFLSLGTKIIIYLQTLLLVPLASIIEGSAILYSIVKPIKTFEIVNKN